MTEAAAAGTADAAAGAVEQAAEGRWVLRLSDILIAHALAFALIAAVSLMLLPLFGWSYLSLSGSAQVLATAFVGPIASLIAVGVVVRSARVGGWTGVGLVPATRPMLLVAALLGLLLQVLNVVVEQALVRVGIDTGDPQANVLSAGETWTGLLGLALTVGLLVPFAEELLHRGVWYGSLRRYLGVWQATLISSAVFGLLHGWNAVLPFAFVVGVVAALLYERTRSLWPSVAFHTALNLAALLLVALGRTGQ